MYLTRTDQFAKTRKVDFEVLGSPNITINMTCEIKSWDHRQDLATSWKLLQITVFDRNDNPVTVDELSKKVDIFRPTWSYKKASGDLVFLFDFISYSTNSEKK